MLSLCPSSAWATEYFISNKAGSGAGTQGDPYGMADLPPADDMYKEGKACSALQPGDTLTFLPGLYELQTSGGTVHGYIRPARSGTPDKPITFRARPGDEVILRAVSGTQGVLGTMKTLGWVGLDNIRFLGLTVECREPFDKEANNELCGMRLLGKNIEVGWCKVLGQKIPTTNNYDGIRIEGAHKVWVHHTEITGWQGDSWNVVGIKVYTSSDCIIEDNYIHGNHDGIYDKDSGQRNQYRRNYITANTEGQFNGNNQGKPASYDLYENVIDGGISLHYLNDGASVHDNLIRNSDALTGAWAGETYNTGIWNNVVLSNGAKLQVLAMGQQRFSTEPGKASVAFLDYNVYTAAPAYEFGKYNKSGMDSFDLEQMRSRGFEKNSKVVSGVAEIYEDEKSYKLKPQWLKAGRHQDPIGPDDVATILDLKRYGPFAMPASGSATRPATIPATGDTTRPAGK